MERSGYLHVHDLEALPLEDSGCQGGPKLPRVRPSPSGLVGQAPAQEEPNAKPEE